MSALLSTSNSKIRAGLRQRLSEVSGIPAVRYWARQNRDFTKPDQSIAWLREAFVPQTNAAASVSGEARLIRHNGVYSIDLFFPLGKGTNEADTLCDAIISRFAPGSSYVYEGQVIRIKSAYAGPAQPQEQLWYFRPVTIVWQADNTTT